ncbi:glycosyltransferase family 2 protein [Rhodoferax sp.]|uniref:glycosyltransferase family 2 protein n=1 Tax=Rhodoferax sp. TaxID=50421 RepID=UPI00261512C2|nr:glycosyltransferase family 2 protein [Rhodoferax sp.]MDD4960469.1 glycosyltransferase family 2 protein [Gallionella sp.]MDD5481244.1 glycosyltransferase family 2 protein [Rhodoferax sp.]
MTSNTQVSIIIVNWNAGAQLAHVVSSIDKYHHGLVATVIIVDNASSDDSLEQVSLLQNLSFKPMIIRNSENLGFGHACNLGAKKACSHYLLFLNPDAALYSDTLPKTMAFMQDPANAKVGICGVQLLDESGHVSRSCAWFPSVPGLFAHALGLDRIFPSMGHFMADWDHTKTRVVEHVIGAFFLVRTELFKDLAGFDTRFFVYLEDLDFSFRAHLTGYRSVYLADAQAFHAGGGTSNQIKARRLFYSLQSRLLYAFKHFSWLGAVVTMLATLFIEPFSRSLWALLRGSWAGLKETWIAYGLLMAWLLQRFRQAIFRH